MSTDSGILEALAAAVYTTDADGLITFYNAAAARLWGHRPEIGVGRWCGAWRLHRLDGRPMSPEDSPMAVALREGQVVHGFESVAERPDGTRVPFVSYPSLLRDDAGRVTGAVCLLVDSSDEKEAHLASARLAAIVSSSDDAIISKTLEGRITSWNAGATRIFGYEAEEIIGRSITTIIPPELLSEEDAILSKLKRGERIEHFDTVRVAKDGRRVDISLAVSPLRDKSGDVIGASKVARDISERKRNEEQQTLLFEELNHRVKNTLAIIQAIASQSLRTAPDPARFIESFHGRIQALARAHDLLVERKMKSVDLAGLVREQVLVDARDGNRIGCSGPLLPLDPRTAVQLSLVLHELATNARKYGALSVATGRLSINWRLRQRARRELELTWTESGVPIVRAPTTHGFGTDLIRRSLEAGGGAADLHWGPDGMTCELRLPLPEECDRAPSGTRSAERRNRVVHDRPAAADLHGARILVIEDEPFVAMDLEAQLTALGAEVVGTAATVEKARALVAGQPADAALLDADLGGCPVDDVAAALTREGIPFAFATGYGRDALPCAFRHAPILGKPFGGDQLLAVLQLLLRRRDDVDRVVPIDSKRL